MEVPMSFVRISIFGGLLLFSSAAMAHHTADNLDFDKTVELAGTVVEFQWTNPYTALRMDVTDESGTTEEWLLDLNSPGSLSRQGWDASTLKPGDDIDVTIYPLLDGSPGGRALTLVLPDGTVSEQ
jgi:hypothetical protein